MTYDLREKQSNMRGPGVFDVASGPLCIAQAPFSAAAAAAAAAHRMPTTAQTPARHAVAVGTEKAAVQGAAIGVQVLTHPQQPVAQAPAGIILSNRSALKLGVTAASVSPPAGHSPSEPAPEASATKRPIQPPLPLPPSAACSSPGPPPQAAATPPAAAHHPATAEAFTVQSVQAPSSAGSLSSCEDHKSPGWRVSNQQQPGQQLEQQQTTDAVIPGKDRQMQQSAAQKVAQFLASLLPNYNCQVQQVANSSLEAQLDHLIQHLVHSVLQGHSWAYPAMLSAAARYGAVSNALQKVLQQVATQKLVEAAQRNHYGAKELLQLQTITLAAATIITADRNSAHQVGDGNAAASQAHCWRQLAVGNAGSAAAANSAVQAPAVTLPSPPSPAVVAQLHPQPLGLAVEGHTRTNRANKPAPTALMDAAAGPAATLQVAPTGAAAGQLLLAGSAWSALGSGGLSQAGPPTETPVAAPMPETAEGALLPPSTGLTSAALCVEVLQTKAAIQAAPATPAAAKGDPLQATAGTAAAGSTAASARTSNDGGLPCFSSQLLAGVPSTSAAPSSGTAPLAAGCDSAISSLLPTIGHEVSSHVIAVSTASQPPTQDLSGHMVFDGQRQSLGDTVPLGTQVAAASDAVDDLAGNEVQSIYRPLIVDPVPAQGDGCVCNSYNEHRAAAATHPASTPTRSAPAFSTEAGNMMNKCNTTNMMPALCLECSMPAQVAVSNKPPDGTAGQPPVLLPPIQRVLLHAAEEARECPTSSGLVVPGAPPGSMFAAAQWCTRASAPATDDAREPGAAVSSDCDSQHEPTLLIPWTSTQSAQHLVCNTASADAGGVVADHHASAGYSLQHLSCGEVDCKPCKSIVSAVKPASPAPAAFAVVENTAGSKRRRLGSSELNIVHCSRLTSQPLLSQHAISAGDNCVTAAGAAMAMAPPHWLDSSAAAPDVDCCCKAGPACSAAKEELGGSGRQLSDGHDAAGSLTRAVRELLSDVVAAVTAVEAVRVMHKEAQAPPAVVWPSSNL